ncbi:hypothetical protein ACJRPK_14065 [Aquimarina sp. 2-A2]|uniref:hypothetical protein n=1 Tax=Aquimarina sp. 2-A2 TaxID=3382644 RepID=UPI00387F10D1
MMNVSQSISRLIYKFSKAIKNDDGTKRKNVKPIYVDQNDLDALKNIVKWVNDQKKESISQQRMFAKIFIKKLEFEIWRTSSYEMALEKIQSELSVSLESHYKSFRNEMMMFNFDMACQMVGVPADLDFKKGITVDERKSHAKEVLKCIKDNEIELKKEIISEHWNEENTNTRLNDLISDLINNYGDRH